MVLIDSNILLDIWQNDPHWAPGSTKALQILAATDELAINTVVFAEASVRFPSHLVVEKALTDLGISLLEIPNEAAFLAGKAFLLYRKKGGTRTSVLGDFFIGAHASVLACPILTRDDSRYRTYFPSVPLITP